MATTSSLGENRVPKPSNQGSAGPYTVTPARTSDRKPGGHLSGTPKLSQPQRAGVTPKGVGGSGDGQNKGAKLPR